MAATNNAVNARALARAAEQQARERFDASLDLAEGVYGPQTLRHFLSTATRDEPQVSPLERIADETLAAPAAPVTMGRGRVNDALNFDASKLSVLAAIDNSAGSAPSDPFEFAQPEGTDQTVTQNEDQTRILSLSDFGFTDTDGDGFAGVQFTGAPTGGTLYFAAGGGSPVVITTFPTPTYSTQDIGQGYLTFVPTLNLNGNAAASISFAVVDDGDVPNVDPAPNVLTIDLAPVNDAPTFSAAAFMTRVSSTSAGGNGNAGVSFESGDVSADGAKVLFTSDASNLVPGDANGQRDVFLKDLVTGEITRVSTSASGAQGTSGSYDALLSADSAKVVFTSGAPNLVAGDGGGADVFVKTLATGAIERISVSASGFNLSGGSSGIFAPDGAKVAFHGDDNQIYIKTLATGVLERVSTNGAGVLSNGTNTNVVFSPDGTKIAFSSTATNLVAGDTNGLSDVFVKDLATGVVTLVSVAPDGSQADGFSSMPAFSPDGTKIVFRSGANNMSASDADAGTFDIFVRDLVANTTTLVSANASGVGANNFSTNLTVRPFSPDGSTVYFSTHASNLVAGDTNGVFDIFGKNLITGEVTRVSLRENGTQSQTSNAFDAITTTGGAVLFRTSDRLVSSDTDSHYDQYLVNPGNGPVIYAENAGPVALVGAVNVSDIDSANFDGGTFSAEITTGSAAGDRLTIAQAGGITTSGDSVLFNGVGIGVLTATATSLTVALDVDANADAVEALAEAIRFDSTSDNPGAIARTTTFTLADGDGGSNSFTRAVAVTVRNDAPSGTDATLTLNEDTPRAFTAADFGYSDVDGNNLGAVVISTLPATGTLTLSGAPVTAGQAISPSSLSNLVYTPVANANGIGSASFAFQVRDDGGTTNGGANQDASANTITFNIDGVNDAPVVTVAAPADFARVGAEIRVNTATVLRQDGAQITALADGGFVVTWSDLSQDEGGAGGDASVSAVKAQVFAAGGTPVGTEIRVNTATENNQQLPQITALSNGGFVVTWYDFSQSVGGATGDASGPAVKAQVFAAGGTPVGTEILVNTATSSSQLLPQITALSNGGFVVTWSDFSQGVGGATGDFDNGAVKAQVFAAGGARVGTEIRVNTATAGNQNGAQITALAEGGFVVTWQDTSQSVGGAVGDSSVFAVKAQVFAAGGAPVGAEILVNTATESSQSAPQITALSNGSFVVTWQDLSQGVGGATGDTVGSAVKAQVFAAGGAPVGTEILVNTATASDQYSPQITALSNGGFVVTWQDSSQSVGGATGDASGAAVKAQVFAAGGTPVGTEILVNTASANNQLDLQITALANGGFVVTWSDFSQGVGGATGDSNLYAVKAQVFTAGGAPVGTEILVNTAIVGDQKIPQIAALADGGFVVTWHDSSNGNGGATGDTSGGAVKAQVFAPLPTSFTATEQTALNLKGAMTVSDVDAGASTLTATLSVGYGVIDATTGNSGVTIVSGNGTGSVVVSGTQAQLSAFLGNDSNSAIAYTPDTDAPPASTTITLSVNDGGNTGSGGAQIGSASETIVITAVNDAPQGADATFTINEDGSRVFAAADFGFSDAADGDNFTGLVITTLPTNGVLLLNGVAVTVAGTFVTAAQINANQFVFQPDANQSGSPYGSFTFQVRDDGGVVNSGQDTDQSANTVTFDINPINDAPVTTVPGAQTINENASVTLSTGNGNAIRVADIDATTLTVTLSIADGTLTIASTLGLSFSVGDGTADATMTLSGTAAAINAALGAGLTYNPEAGFNGSDAISVVTTDNGQSGGAAQTDSDTITVNITAINDAPVVIGDGTESATTINEDAPGAGQTLQALFAGQYSDAADNQIPNGGASSPGQFSGVAITANGSSAETGQWQTFSGGVWTDIGAASASAAVLLGDPFVTLVRFNPAPDYNGPAPTLTVHLIDNSLPLGIVNGQVVDLSGPGATGRATPYSSGTVVLGQTVTAVNDAPVAENGSAAADVGTLIEGQLVAEDIDDDVVSYALIGDPLEGLEIDPSTGAYTFDSSEGFDDLGVGDTRVVTFQFTATDEFGDTSALRTVTLTLTGVNATPVAAAPEAVEVLESDEPVSGQLTATDTDDAAEDLIYALVEVAPAGFALASDGSWTFDPSAYELTDGTEQLLTIEYTVSDDQGASDTATLTITITGVNDAPVVEPATASVTEDLSVSGFVTGTDPDANRNTLIRYELADTAPTGLTFNPDGSYSFDASGYDSLAAGEVRVLVVDFRCISEDEYGERATSQTLTITMTGTNDLPVASAATNGTTEGSSVSGTVPAATDVDGRSSIVSYQLTAPAPTGLTFNADGAYVFDGSGFDALGQGQTGTLTVNYTATDNNGGLSAPQTLTITVTGIAGTSGNDTVRGTAGNDVLNGGAGSDNIFGGSGDDTFIGGMDGVGDTFRGEGGNDTVDYSDATGGMNINLPNSAYSVATGSDQLFGIENAVGSAFADSISGTTGDNRLTGGLGNDTLNGNAGIDTAVINSDAANGIAVQGASRITVTTADGVDLLRNIEFIEFDNAVIQVNGATGNAFAWGVDDVGAAAEDGGAVVGNVLANDIEIEGEAIHVASARAGSEAAGGVMTTLSGATMITGAHGVLTINANGSYNYVVTNNSLAGGEEASDLFTYRVADGANEGSLAQLAFTVTGAGPAPAPVWTAAKGSGDAQVLPGIADDAFFGTFDDGGPLILPAVSHPGETPLRDDVVLLPNAMPELLPEGGFQPLVGPHDPDWM